MRVVFRVKVLTSKIFGFMENSDKSKLAIRTAYCSNPALNPNNLDMKQLTLNTNHKKLRILTICLLSGSQFIQDFWTEADLMKWKDSEKNGTVP